MITKSDLYLLLDDINKRGIDTTKQLKILTKSDTIPLDVLRFINDNRQLDLSKFYEKIRKSYNNKHSVLYINIVKEIQQPNEVLSTLSAMLTQIFLFSRIVENREMFLKHARAKEITAVLDNYLKTFNLVPCIKLIKLIRSDLKVLEGMKAE